MDKHDNSIELFAYKYDEQIDDIEHPIQTIMKTSTSQPTHLSLQIETKGSKGYKTCHV